MAIDHSRIHTSDERARTRHRCPECSAPLVVSWRRAHESGRSEDLYTINKISCPNRCAFDPDDI